MSHPDDEKLRFVQLPAIIHFNADIKTKYEQLIVGFYLPAIRQVLTRFSPHCVAVLRRFWDDIHLTNFGDQYPPQKAFLAQDVRAGKLLLIYT